MSKTNLLTRQDILSRQNVPQGHRRSVRSVLIESTNYQQPDRIKTLASENHELRILLQDQKAEINRINQQTTTLKLSLDQAANQMRKTAEQHLHQLHQLQSTIQSINREKGKLVEECARNQMAVAEANKLKAEAQLKQVAVTEELKQYQYLEKALNTLKRDNKQLTMEVEKLKKEQVPSSNPLPTSNHQIFILTEKLDWLAEQKKEQEAKHEQALNRLNSKVEFYKQQISKATEEIEYLKNKCRSYEEKSVQLQSIKSQYNALCHEHTKMEKKFKQQTAEMQQHYTELKQKYTQQKQYIVQLRQSLEHTQHQTTKQHNQMSQNAQQMQQQNMRLEQQLLRSQQEQCTAYKQTEQLRQELMNINEQNEQLRHKCGRMAEQVHRLNEQIGHLTSVTSMTSQMNNQNKQLALQITKLKSQNNKLVSESSRLSSQNSRLVGETSKTKKQLLESAKTILALKEEIKSNLQMYLEQRQSLSSKRSRHNQQQLIEVIRVLEHNVAEKSETISKMEIMLREMSDSIKTTDNHQRQRQQSTKILESTIRQQHQSINILQRRLQQQNQTVNMLQEQLKTQSIKIHEQQGAILHYTQKLVGKSTELDEEQKIDVLIVLEKLQRQQQLHHKTRETLQLMKCNLNDAIMESDRLRHSFNAERAELNHTVLSYQKMVRELQEQIQAKYHEIATVKKELSKVQDENAAYQIQKMSQQYNTAHLEQKVQEDRHKRMTIYTRLSIDGTHEEVMLEQLCSKYSSMEAKVQQLTKINSQLKESVSLGNKETELLRDKCVQLEGRKSQLEAKILEMEAKCKADRALIIKMQDEHQKILNERGRVFQMEYDALLNKYEKYKGIARREKSRKDAQKLLIRESNDFNEVMIQKCKAILK